MPGIAPSCASSRRQIRHSLNLRKTALGRPQRLQRVYACTLCFGARFCFTRSEVLAMLYESLLSVAKGSPSSRKSARACSSFSAVVVMAMSRPRIAGTLS
jgi:hypothetical protein